MIERRDRKGAAELQPPSTAIPHVLAITYFARALAQAQTGHPDLARADLAKLVELRDKLREAPNCSVVVNAVGCEPVSTQIPC